jgi:hypothetical protein
MSVLTRVFAWLYAQGLKLYPADFRTDFGAETEDVFTQAIYESRGPAMAFCLREVKDLPGNLSRQHWLAVRKEKVPMTTRTETRRFLTEERQPGTWGAAFLAGLPQLLMGLLLGLGKFGVFDVYESSQTTSLVIGISLVLLVIGILIYAWRLGWPLWSASWYLYGTWVTLAVLGLIIESLDLEDSWRYTNALFLGWILLCIIGYFLILSKSKLHGLLSVAFLFPLLGISGLEYTPPDIDGWFALAVGLLTALSAGALVRIGDSRLGLAIVLGVDAVVGLAWAYISEYKMLDLPSGVPAHVPRFGKFLQLLALYGFLALGIIALPFLLRGLWNFGKRKFTQ